MDFNSIRSSLVPKPRVNPTRFHGVFTRGGLPPNSKHRAVATKASAAGKNRLMSWTSLQHPRNVGCRVSMIWLQRLNRVLNIDIKICTVCGGTAKGIACIEDPIAINKVLDHLEKKSVPTSPTLRLSVGQHRWASSLDANTKRPTTALAAAVAF